MKIIKQGHDEDRMRVVCQKCEAVLEITSEDVCHEPSVDSIWGNYYYNCPCCGTKKNIERYEMTKGVYNAVLEALINDAKKNKE